MVYDYFTEISDAKVRVFRLRGIGSTTESEAMVFEIAVFRIQIRIRMDPGFFADPFRVFKSTDPDPF